MNLALTPAETAAWTSAGIALLALIAVVVFGVLNLRRAARGPEGSPKWSVEHSVKARYELVQTGTADALDVRVEFEGAPRVDGERQFDVFAINQRASYVVMTSWGSGTPNITVSWQPRKGPRREWISDLPRGS